VVYGVDDRVEWYAYPDAELQARVRAASVVHVYTRDVQFLPDGSVTLDPGPTLGQSADLCADQRFFDQPTSGSCSGTLIAPDLVLTAGHCVTNRDDCAGAVYVFDYLFEGDGVMPALDRDDVYRCAGLAVDADRHIPGDLDLAIVQLDRPVVGRTPVEVASTLSVSGLPATRGPLEVGEPLVMAGFPNGIPLKIDAGGEVTNPRSGASDFFVASVDAFHGNSGSGVYDASGRLVGVLTDGMDDYTSLGSCAIVSVQPESGAREGVHYAFRAVAALCDRGFPSPLCPGNEARCGDDFCNHPETSESCPRDCDGPFAVPEGWTCSLAWFAARDDCDCDCGVRDPDCDVAGLRILNCARGSRCDAAGQCTVPLPDAWRCNWAFYNAGDDCDCDCGAWDPDCGRAGLRTVGCRDGGQCLADGTCSNPAPDGWTCGELAWGTGNACHCGCGAPDPDCELGGRAIVGCAPGSACLPDGTCEAPFPETWVCPRANYGSGGACDCNCGAPDPDCDTSLAAPLNCGAGLACGPDGTCVDPEALPEPGPEPVPEPVPEAPSEEPVEADAFDGPDAGPEVSPDAAPEATPDPVERADATEGPEPGAPQTSVIQGRRVEPGLGCGSAGAGGLPLAGLVVLVGLSTARRTARRGRDGALPA
jgi:V8-like Glu-specific endopeptidase